jgi:hypothetical protein
MSKDANKTQPKRIIGTPFQPGNPGRPKGVPNKQTITVKSALQDAFHGMGGTPALMKWGMENPTEFYRIWSRLLPVDINHTADADFARILAEARLRIGGEFPPAKPALPIIDVPPEDEA